MTQTNTKKTAVSAKDFLDTWEKTASATLESKSAQMDYAHTYRDFMEQAIFAHPEALQVTTTQHNSVTLPQGTVDELQDPTQMFLSAITLTPKNIEKLFTQANRMEAASQVPIMKEYLREELDAASQHETNDIRMNAKKSMEKLLGDVTSRLGLTEETAIDPTHSTATTLSEKSAARA